MLSTMQSSGNNGEGESYLDGDRNTKKVRFKESAIDDNVSMAVDTEPQQAISWKDKLLGTSVGISASGQAMLFAGNDNDFDLLDGDVNTSIIDGILTIEFSNRINEILFKEMERTVIVKLLGRNIGYNALFNRILFLWNPVNSIRLMDIANGYLLVKFQDSGDYNKALSQGPWTVYGQYLTIQPWTKHFNPMQPYPSVELSWIRLLNLLGHFYKRKIIEAIGGLIGKVVKLDVQIDNQTRGRFARLAVYINLDRPLISQVYIDGLIQRVEYEALPTVCFDCGKYGHVKEMCTPVGTNQNATDLNVTLENARGEPMVGERSSSIGNSNGESTVSDSNVKGPEFGPWMLVEKRTSRRGKRETKKEIPVKHENLATSSRFSALSEERDLGVDSEQVTGAFARKELGDKVASKSRERFSRDFSIVDKSRMESGQSLAKDIMKPRPGELFDSNLESHSNGFKERKGGDKGRGNQSTKKTYFALRGRESRFKASGNSRVPLTESMESMAELLSSQMFNEMSNSKFDGAGAKTDNNTGHKS
ncbi:hypothetical protein J1N35_015560 [Gossypium stocksii]|uniref:CCHC-type domain-containing protein n=1 Tax=Gossypium stocksii TaxID=47602 RepID=A0A9D3VYI7_9ROSI|nr:hypothetical protein J1N35_015560 [Gossypium stocksii]